MYSSIASDAGPKPELGNFLSGDKKNVSTINVKQTADEARSQLTESIDEMKRVLAEYAEKLPEELTEFDFEKAVRDSRNYLIQHLSLRLSAEDEKSIRRQGMDAISAAKAAMNLNSKLDEGVPEVLSKWVKTVEDTLDREKREQQEFSLKKWIPSESDSDWERLYQFISSFDSKDDKPLTKPDSSEGIKQLLVELKDGVRLSKIHNNIGSYSLSRPVESIVMESIHTDTKLPYRASENLKRWWGAVERSWLKASDKNKFNNFDTLEVWKMTDAGMNDLANRVKMFCESAMDVLKESDDSNSTPAANVEAKKQNEVLETESQSKSNVSDRIATPTQSMEEEKPEILQSSQDESINVEEKNTLVDKAIEVSKKSEGRAECVSNKDNQEAVGKKSFPNELEEEQGKKEEEEEQGKEEEEKVESKVEDVSVGIKEKEPILIANTAKTEDLKANAVNDTTISSSINSNHVEETEVVEEKSTNGNLDSSSNEVAANEGANSTGSTVFTNGLIVSESSKTEGILDKEQDSVIINEPNQISEQSRIMEEEAEANDSMIINSVTKEPIEFSSSDQLQSTTIDPEEDPLFRVGGQGNHPKETEKDEQSGRFHGKRKGGKKGKNRQNR